MRLTHIGGPTALIELGGWTLLTDPTFDAPGGHYRFGWGTSSDKLAGPAIAAADLPPLDAILLSHDHHEDNLDAAGRALLPAAGEVITTASGAKRLGFGRGLVAWEGTTLEAPGKPRLEIIATPCRHGPPLSHPIVGDVIGFTLVCQGTVVWVSGDTVLYEGVRSVAGRWDIDVALIHLGGVQFPDHRTGPLHHDRRRRGRARGPAQAEDRRPDPLRGLEALPAGPRRDRAGARRRARRRARALPLGGDRHTH